MHLNFLDHTRDIEDPRLPGMVLYPLDEVLLSVLVGLLCRTDDVDEIEDTCTELPDWLRLFAPFRRGIARRKPCDGHWRGSTHDGWRRR
jgi:hypothetical protein